MSWYGTHGAITKAQAKELAPPRACKWCMRSIRSQSHTIPHTTSKWLARQIGKIDGQVDPPEVVAGGM